MLLQKTEKARLELSPGVRTLSLRERSLLLLADGKPLSDLQAMYNGIGAQIVENLMRQGYLTGPADLPPAPEPTAVPTPSITSSGGGASTAGSRPASTRQARRVVFKRSALSAGRDDSLLTARASGRVPARACWP